MANTQAVCKNFRPDLLNGLHAFGTTVVRAGTGADTFKMALFLATATINADTATYSSTGELAATGNYTAGGVAVTNGNAPSTTGGTGIVLHRAEKTVATTSRVPRCIGRTVDCHRSNRNRKSADFPRFSRCPGNDCGGFFKRLTHDGNKPTLHLA